MKPAKATERLVWAVGVLAVQPDDRLLEIGCGHGVAVSLVCEKLAGGSIMAIDRSAKMIEMARRRNAGCVAAGKAFFQTVSLAEADFGATHFDKIFAIHVGVFLRGRPARELVAIRRCLSPGGGLYLIYQPLAVQEAGGIVERLSAVLEEHGFTVRTTLVEKLTAATAVCVVAEL